MGGWAVETRDEPGCRTAFIVTQLVIYSTGRSSRSAREDTPFPAYRRLLYRPAPTCGCRRSQPGGGGGKLRHRHARRAGVAGRFRPYALRQSRRAEPAYVIEEPASGSLFFDGVNAAGKYAVSGNPLDFSG